LIQLLQKHGGLLFTGPLCILAPSVPRYHTYSYATQFLTLYSFFFILHYQLYQIYVIRQLVFYC